ncbi:MAG: hypothetical protein V3W11_05965 [bacterium]
MKKLTISLRASLVIFGAVCFNANTATGGSGDLGDLCEFVDKGNGRELRDDSTYWVDQHSKINVSIPQGFILEYVVTRDGKEHKREDFTVDDAEKPPKYALEAEREEVIEFFRQPGEVNEGMLLRFYIESVPEWKGGAPDLSPKPSPDEPLPWTPSPGTESGGMMDVLPGGLEPAASPFAKAATAEAERVPEQAGTAGGVNENVSLEDFKGDFYFPVREDDGGKYELGHVGDTVNFYCYVPYGKGERKLIKKVSLEIIRSGPELFEWSSFAMTPVVNVEVGKQTGTGPGGEEESGTGISPGFGLSYLIFFKYPTRPWLYNLGFGGNFSYSNTELWDEEAGKARPTNVTTAGFAAVYKIDPLLFGVILGTNTSGDDRYFQLAFTVGNLLGRPSKPPS